MASLVGHIASLALHGPPLALFVSTWLTHSLLIGYSGPLANHVRMVPAYQVPSTLLASGRPLGEGPGASGGGKTSRRRGLRGRSGRGARRGMVAPRTVKPLLDAAVAEQNAFLAWLDASEGMISAGTAATGDGAALAGDGGGQGEGGKGRGAGDTGHSTEGAGGESVAVGTPPALAAAPPSPKPPAPPRGHAATGAGNDKGPSDDIAEEEDVVAPPAPNRPYKASYLSETMAAYFRTYEVFPGMPESFWYGGVTNYLLAIEVCVSTEGSVSNVTFQQGANEDVDKLVGSAIRSWRYRPRIVAGSPRPFCHPIRIEYIRGSRSFAH